MERWKSYAKFLVQEAAIIHEWFSETRCALQGRHRLVESHRYEGLESITTTRCERCEFQEVTKTPRYTPEMLARMEAMKNAPPKHSGQEETLYIPYNNGCTTAVGYLHPGSMLPWQRG